MSFLLSIVVIASDGIIHVSVDTEQAAENLIKLLDRQSVDYVDLYRVHEVPVGPEGDNPYEHIRTVKVKV